MKNVKIKPVFAWYDLWVGLFVDVPKQTAYVFPIPMFGLKISWEPKRTKQVSRRKRWEIDRN